VSGYFAIRFKLTNVPGVIDPNNLMFANTSKRIQDIPNINSTRVKGVATVGDIQKQIDDLKKIATIRQENICKINVIGKLYPANASRIVSAAIETNSDAIVMKMIAAVELRLKNNTFVENQISQCSQGAPDTNAADDYSSLGQKFSSEGQNVFDWSSGSEWNAIRQATLKDKDKILDVGKKVDIEPRIIVASMIVEQLRLFYSEREVFKKVFEPLKILCSANKISLGVMGIKEATAIDIENHLKDRNSPYYLGLKYEHLLDFTTEDVTSERYNRLVDDKNHYYSYLYGALYLKQFMKQWKDVGYDITYRPEIVGTLFNVGFPQSKPKDDPKVGGSSIGIGEQSYSYGSLVYEFYYSGEMMDDFPFRTGNN
jgi:hypothetical protein